MNQKMYKHFLLFLSLFILFNCKDNTKSEETNSTKISLNLNETNAGLEKEINFDNILEDCYFTYDEGYFITADHGCLYEPNGKNKFGNLIIYLVPKNQITIKDQNIENENKRVNSLNTEEYKNEFNIYVFLTENKYLNFNPNSDPIYYHKPSYIEKLYNYNSKNIWSLIDSINISDSKSNEKEQIWRDDFMSKLLNNLGKNNLTEITNSFSEKWLGTFKLTINENSKDWRDTQEITLEISKNAVKYSVEGYQIDQRYILYGSDLNNNLMLTYQSALENTESGVLDKTKNFGEISFDGKNYRWVCPYNDISFMDGKTTTYVLKKK